jgi:hypothetical protein
VPRVTALPIHLEARPPEARRSLHPSPLHDPPTEAPAKRPRAFDAVGNEILAIPYDDPFY